MTKIDTHCQICGRTIRTVVGYGSTGAANTDMAAGRTDRIAHHGFQRPHQQGWQSGSCFGARWRPYEVASDALPSAIKSTESYIAHQQIGLAKFMLEPPAKLQYTSRRSFKSETVDVPRPEGFKFDPDRKSHQMIIHSYEHLYLNQRVGYLSNIRQAEMALAAMQKRLAEWKAPAETAA